MKKQLKNLCLLTLVVMGLTACSEQSKVEKAAKAFVTALNTEDIKCAVTLNPTPDSVVAAYKGTGTEYQDYVNSQK